MSLATLAPIKENLFNTYLVNQDEDNTVGDSDKPEEKPTETPSEPTSVWTHEPYAPGRVSFHTVQGKIKRFFA